MSSTAQSTMRCSTRWAITSAVCALLVTAGAPAQRQTPAADAPGGGWLLPAERLQQAPCDELRHHYGLPDVPMSTAGEPLPSAQQPVLELDCQGFRDAFLGGRKAGTAELDRSVRLTETCSFPDTNVVVTAPRVVLDCGGSEFRGNRKLTRGLSLRENEPQSATSGAELPALDDIRITRCRFTHFAIGVVLSSALNRHNPADAQLYDGVLGGMFERRQWDIPGRASPADRLRALSPKNLRLSHVSVSHARVGVYVHDHLQGVDVDHVVVRDARIGVYLDHGSRGTTIRNSCFLDSRGREAVAIDASAGNLVAGNLFYGNPNGAVALYKNCSENIDAPHQFHRRQWAIGNRIAHNALVGDSRARQKHALIEIARRQWHSYPPKKGCGDPKRHGRKGGRIQDYAQFNLVDSNLFVSRGTSIRIADDGNAVRGNLFVAPGRRRAPVIEIGSRFDAEYRGRGVRSNEVSNNRLATAATQYRPARLSRDSVRFVTPSSGSHNRVE